MTRLVPALALLACAAVSVPAHAEQQPIKGRYDPRMRVVAYNSMNPVTVNGTTFISTQITFAVGEKIIHVAIGDDDAWMKMPADNLLFIKPVEVRAPTNMQVVTVRPDGTQRSYPFVLIARAGSSAAGAQVASLDGTTPAAAQSATPFGIQFVYPGDAREEALARRRQQAAGASERTAESRLAVDYFYGPRNWRYTAQGSQALEPAEVSDNGQVTAMRFLGNSIVPPIYAVASDGQETLIPMPAMRGDVAVISMTAPEFRLRSGNEVLRIFNKGYSAQGINPQTGTTSPEVVRVIRGASR